MTAKGELTGRRLDNLRAHAEAVIAVLRIKNPKYGDSWKSHGGFSAFFNTQRKWSRIENLASKHGYDIFEAMRCTALEPDGMAEAIKDQIGYLLLILDECEDLSAPVKIDTTSVSGGLVP